MTNTTQQKYPAHVELTNPAGGLTSIGIDAIDGNVIVNIADLHGAGLLGSDTDGFTITLNHEFATTNTGEPVALAMYSLTGLALISSDVTRVDGPRIEQLYTGLLTNIRGYGPDRPTFPDGPFGNDDAKPPVIDTRLYRVQLSVSTTVAVTPKFEGRPDHDY